MSRDPDYEIIFEPIKIDPETLKTASIKCLIATEHVPNDLGLRRGFTV